MKQITKGREPLALTEFRSGGGTWDGFSSANGKGDVKNQLLQEQHDLCAYCTGSINFDTMKVEHWCPRSLCPTNRDLDYSNLLAVCKGCFSSGEFFHCDTSKKDILIELNPLNSNHISTLSYQYFSGTLISTKATLQKEIDTVLNLNIEPLKKNRKTVISTFKEGLAKKYKGKRANYPKELEIWKSKTSSFSMIVVKYLENKVR